MKMVDSGLQQGGSNGGCEKWMESRYILNVKPIRFPGLNWNVKEKRKSRMTLGFLPWATLMKGVPST